jgi:hypothetical protein
VFAPERNDYPLNLISIDASSTRPVGSALPDFEPRPRIMCGAVRRMRQPTSWPSLLFNKHI